MANVRFFLQSGKVIQQGWFLRYFFFLGGSYLQGSSRANFLQIAVRFIFPVVFVDGKSGKGNIGFAGLYP